jgi:polyribonucleotide nucleotidyltransferase
MPEVGERFLGTVVKTTTFGAFVSLLPGKDGLLHITQIRKLHGGRRIENIDEVVHIGDKIQVEIREVDDRGKLSLVPVEVVEREAAGEDLSGGESRGGDRGDRPRESRDRGGDRGGDREGDGGHRRTRHRSRGHQD